MLLVDCSNNIKCWDCQENCNIRKAMDLPDFIFVSDIMDLLKANAGLCKLQGFPFDKIEEELKITAVGLYLARQKFFEERKK